jgi:hypothetical protein
MEYEEALKDILTCDKEKLKELGIWDKIYDKGIDRTLYIRGASKIKVKNVNKTRMATARRLIFFGISQGIHC